LTPDELPQVSDPRTKFERTKCACEKCKVCCRHMPGCLIPGDLEQIAEYSGVDLDTEFGERWVQDHFRASEGAQVFHPASRTMMQVPTIVPASRPNGRCVFLDDSGGCTIHDVAPFGCAYHDMHIEGEDAHRRSDLCVQYQLNDALNTGDHTNKWLVMLATNGLQAPSLKFRRDRLQEELREVERGQEEAQADPQSCEG
jgi:Fe-S-cluster containining protein